jgi:hypothetical protein
MNLTLSIDERLVKEARQVASAMGKSLNQLVREYLEDLTALHDAQGDIEELQQLTAAGQGHSRGWRFDREEVHERAELP